jgi:uncharacterized protein YggE
MRGLRLILFAAIAAAPAPLAAAQLVSDTIVASGEAQIRVRPDTASIDIGVVTASSTAASALRANSSEMARVLAAIREIGIPDAAMQTSNFSIDAQHPHNRAGEEDETRTVGYAVTNKLTVTVNDLSKVADIIDSAVRAGANSANSATFGLKARGALADKVLFNAIRNARHNAEIMAAAQNLRIGRMLTASDENSSIEGGLTIAQPDGIANTPVLPGEVTIEAHVTAVFSMRLP